MSIVEKALSRLGLQRKSANGVGQSILASTRHYISPSDGAAPSDLALEYRNAAYACGRKISEYVGSVPIHLYSGKSISLTPHKAVPSRLVKSMLSDPRLSSKATNKVTEVVEHPLLALVRNPTPRLGTPAWLGLVAEYVATMGNCLIEVVKDGDTVTSLPVLEWERVTPQLDSNGDVVSWHYIPLNGSMRVIPASQCIHVIQPSIGSTRFGRGRLEACIDSARLWSWYDAYAISLARNYGQPGINVNVKDKPANMEEAKKLAAEFQEKFGRTNIGRPIVSFGHVDVTPTGIPPREMEYSNGRKWALKSIAMCYGVPEDLISTEDSNRASSVTAINQFLQVTCFPLLGLILEQLNDRLPGEYDDSLYLWYDQQEALGRDPAVQAAVLNGYVASGVMTVDEARSAIGLAPKEEV